MSGGKGHTEAVDQGADDAIVVLMPKVRKVEVIAHEEIYYPRVSIVRAEEIKVRIVNESEKIAAEEVMAKELPAEEPVVKAVKEPALKVIEKTAEPKKRGWRLWRARIATVAVTLVGMAAVVLVGLRLVGYRTFTVMSGSMEPDLPVGSMVYVRPVDYQNLKVGDIISYVANNENTIVTHRIVEIEVDEKDASVRRFKTKGDANATADGNLVHYKNVLGTPVFIIPQIGYFAHNIQRPPGIYITLVVGTLLLAWTFLPSTLEERRKTARRSIV